MPVWPSSDCQIASCLSVLLITAMRKSYDGLGDALQEAQDDLNDETFGSTGPVGT